VKSPWPGTVAEARAVQQRLAPRVVRRNRLGRVRFVAGTDVGISRDGKTARAAVVVLSFPSLERIDEAVSEMPVVFPYVPGYLSFREIPVLEQALRKLQMRPDLILCDGQGYAHPRRLGLASHLGVYLDMPTIGVAKSRLIGTHGAAPRKKGQWVPLHDGKERVGAVLCTRDGVEPLYISIGHRISLPTAIRYVLACTTRYRLPETTRAADQLASHPSRYRAR